MAQALFGAGRICAAAALFLAALFLPATALGAGVPDERARDGAAAGGGDAAPAGGRAEGAPWAGDPGAAGDGMVRAQLKVLDTEELDRYLQDLGRETAGYLPPLRKESAIDLIRDGGAWRPSGLAAGLARYFVGEVVNSLGLLAKLVVLAVLAAVLHNLQASFQEAAVARAANGVVTLSLVGLALGAFYVAVQMAQDTVGKLVSFMLAALPVFITLLAASGGVIAAGILHPAVAGVVHISSLVVSRWVFPLLFLAAVLDTAGSLAEGVRLSGLARLMRHAGLVGLGLTLCLFLGVTSVLGVAGAVGDGAALRTAKFLAKSFVPVVGGMFSDAAELVATSSLVLRNGVGLVGLMAVLFTVALPILKLLSLILIYRLAAAAVQPVGAGGVASCLEGLAANLALVAVSVGAVALLFFLAVSALVGAGNYGVMLR